MAHVFHTGHVPIDHAVDCVQVMVHVMSIQVSGKGLKVG